MRAACQGDLGLEPAGTFVVAGLLKHARGLCGLAAPTVNSYKAAAARIVGAEPHLLRRQQPRGPGQAAGRGHQARRVSSRRRHRNPYLTLVGLLPRPTTALERVGPGGDPNHRRHRPHSRRGAAPGPGGAAPVRPEALDALEQDAVLMEALGRSSAGLPAPSASRLPPTPWNGRLGEGAYLEHP